MVLSETHQTEAVNDEAIEIEDYDHYYLLSGSSRTGELILYFRKHWQISKTRKPIREHEFWIGAFMAKFRNISTVITAVYRSPSGQ